MTLAEIREVLRREMVAHALSGSPSHVDAMVLRVGRPLVLRHVQPRQRVRWHGALYVVERIERTRVMFDSPRLLLEMSHFLAAVVGGVAQDDA